MLFETIVRRVFIYNDLPVGLPAERHGKQIFSKLYDNKLMS